MNGKSLTQSTLIGMFWSFSGTIVQGLSQFIVLIVLARMISAYEFGIVAASLAVIGFSIIFSNMGVGPALIQKKTLNDAHINTGFTLSVILGCLLTVLFLISSSFIANFFEIIELEKALIYLSFTFIIQSLSIVSQSLLQREMKFKLIAKVQVISYIFGYGFISIILAFFGWGYWSLIIGTITQNIINTIMLMILKPHSKKIEFNKNAFNDLIYFGGGFTVARLFNYIATQGDNLIIGKLLGATSLGIYGRAYQLMVMPANLFGQVVDRVLFSAMSQVQTNIQSLRNSYQAGLMLVALLVMPTSVFIYILAPEIILLLLGKDWLNVVIPFQILTIGMFFRTSYKISDSIARATGYVYQRAWRQGLYAILVMIGCYIGHFWGLEMVVVGVLISLIVNFLLMAHLSIKVLSIKWMNFIKIHFPSIILSFITFLIINSSIDFFRQEFSLVFLLLITSIIFITTILLTILISPKYFIGEQGIKIVAVIKNLIINRKNY